MRQQAIHNPRSSQAESLLPDAARFPATSYTSRTTMLDSTIDQSQYRDSTLPTSSYLNELFRLYGDRLRAT